MDSFDYMCVFFFNDTATTEIYTLSLHDALPISLEFAGRRAKGGGDDGSGRGQVLGALRGDPGLLAARVRLPGQGDRKSTRLNSSHANISYAVFCLKKKKNDIYKIQVCLRTNLTL